MRFRILGTTALRVSVIGLGTWQFGGEWGQAFTQAVVALNRTEQIQAVHRIAAAYAFNL